MGVLLLVRHGQASFGAEDYDVLSDLGWEQSRRLGRWLSERGVRPDVILRGDMKRHRDTVEAMKAGSAGVSRSEVDQGWNEFDHLGVVGALSRSGAGLPTGRDLDRREFQQAFELATQRWTGGENDADYPETYAAFRSRVAAALERASAAAGPGGTVAVISSGGPIAAVCAALVDPTGEDPATFARLWGRFNTVCVNTAVTRVVVGSTGSRLLTFNEHPHLDGDLITYR
ncbi:histidine phosphatase family protein [Nocardioides sp.]|uniref:histidine phosphatase family protein n=1 Tax=Nocardioides sp. TaxID=35761 RepID=UPI0031FECDAC|nr:Phosphoglycerate mutase [Nocardioides sp.]